MSNENAVNAPGQNKTTMIIVDLNEYYVEGKEISYLQVAKLVYPDDSDNSEITYTITYSYKDGQSKELRAGETAKLKEGMVFNVGKSNRS